MRLSPALSGKIHLKRVVASTWFYLFIAAARFALPKPKKKKKIPFDVNESGGSMRRGKLQVIEVQIYPRPPRPGCI